LALQDADDLDFESLLRKVIEKHTKAILTVFQRQLQQGPTSTVFSPAGAVSLVVDGLFTSFVKTSSQSDTFYGIRKYPCPSSSFMWR
jgi:hypothetical protein